MQIRNEHKYARSNIYLVMCGTIFMRIPCVLLKINYTHEIGLQNEETIE